MKIERWSEVLALGFCGIVLGFSLKGRNRKKAVAIQQICRLSPRESGFTLSELVDRALSLSPNSCPGYWYARPRGQQCFEVVYTYREKGCRQRLKWEVDLLNARITPLTPEAIHLETLLRVTMKDPSEEVKIKE